MAQMQGTYNLRTQQINLRGTLKTDADPANTTLGVKALMLKGLDPFFKAKHVGYVMPVKITGTYAHPSFGLDLNGGNHKKRYKENASRFLGKAGADWTQGLFVRFAQIPSAKPHPRPYVTQLT